MALYRSLLLALVVSAAVAGCAQTGPAPGTDADPDFAELQERGRVAMGVDQYTSTHLFDDLPDGGRIELQRDTDDPEGVATIRQHLREISEAFARGDFRIPAFVHDGEVPGTRVMAERRERIRYTFSELPRGGEVRIVTQDPEAIRAVHQFLAFQRDDHRAGGHGGDHQHHQHHQQHQQHQQQPQQPQQSRIEGQQTGGQSSRRDAQSQDGGVQSPSRPAHAAPADSAPHAAHAGHHEHGEHRH